MSDQQPHKFIYKSNGSSVYAQIIFCEYCGHVAFNANDTHIRDRDQAIAKEPCPRCPEVD